MTTFRASLSRDAVARKLDYNPETGLFRWKYRPDRSKQWNTRYAGTEAGQINNGYISVQLDGKGTACNGSRLAWLLHYGEMPPAQVDHINGVRHDNRIANLRLATNAENNMNRAAQKNNQCGIRGLTLHPTAGWRVRCQSHGINHDLGYFQDLDEAIAARKALEEKLHGQFAPNASIGHGRYKKFGT